MGPRRIVMADWPVRIERRLRHVHAPKRQRGGMRPCATRIDGEDRRVAR